MRSKTTLMLEIPDSSVNINLKVQPGIVVGKEDDLIFTLRSRDIPERSYYALRFCHHQKIGQIDIEYLLPVSLLCYHKGGRYGSQETASYSARQYLLPDSFVRYDKDGN